MGYRIPPSIEQCTDVDSAAKANEFILQYNAAQKKHKYVSPSSIAKGGFTTWGFWERTKTVTVRGSFRDFDLGDPDVGSSDWEILGLNVGFPANGNYVWVVSAVWQSTGSISQQIPLADITATGAIPHLGYSVFVVDSGASANHVNRAPGTYVVEGTGSTANFIGTTTTIVHSEGISGAPNSSNSYFRVAVANYLTDTDLDLSVRVLCFRAGDL